MKYLFFALILSVSTAQASKVSCYSSVDDQLEIGLEFDTNQLLVSDHFEAKLNYNKVNSYSSPQDIYYEYKILLGKTRKSNASQYEILDVAANRVPRSVAHFVNKVKFSAEVDSEVNLSGKLANQQFVFNCQSL